MKKLVYVLLLLTLCMCLFACGKEKSNWDDIVLGELLPEPPTTKREIYENSADKLWVDVKNLSDKQFSEFVEACKKKGFNIDAELDSYSFTAYNADGYKLELSHYGNDEDMTIELETPMEMNTIYWPTSVAGKLLPTPKSTTGKFSYEYSDSFSVYISNTTRTDYAEYVNACSEKGFNVDYSKGDDYYYADNSEGWHISLCYEGNNIMSIDIDAPSGDDTTEKAPDTTEKTPDTTEKAPDTTEKTPDTTEKVPDNGGIDPDFKAAMDSYEKFMNEYVAFMKKYQANPGDLALLADYANYMSKYSDVVRDFDKWENGELNNAELSYYIEVQSRVSKKLLEVAQ